MPPDYISILPIINKREGNLDKPVRNEYSHKIQRKVLESLMPTNPKVLSSNHPLPPLAL